MVMEKTMTIVFRMAIGSSTRGETTLGQGRLPRPSLMTTGRVTLDRDQSG